MLSGLGGGVLDDLARMSLEHAVASLLDGTDLGRNAVSGTGSTSLEVIFTFFRHAFNKRIMLNLNVDVLYVP